MWFCDGNRGGPTIDQAGVAEGQRGVAGQAEQAVAAAQVADHRAQVGGAPVLRRGGVAPAVEQRVVVVAEADFQPGVVIEGVTGLAGDQGRAVLAAVGQQPVVARVVLDLRLGQGAAVEQPLLAVADDRSTPATTS